MSRTVDLLLTALNDLAKAHDRLARAAPDLSTAQANVDAALQRVLSLLGDPELTRTLSQLIPAARDRLLSPSEGFDDEFKARRDELLKIEAKLMRHLDVADIDMSRLYMSYERTREQRTQFPQQPDEVITSLARIHDGTKELLTASRTLSRKEKKKRKRKLAQGIASAIFGTGVIVADTQLPVLFAFSYGLGGGALHQALRDIVGEPTDVPE